MRFEIIAVGCLLYCFFAYGVITGIVINGLTTQNHAKEGISGISGYFTSVGLNPTDNPTDKNLSETSFTNLNSLLKKEVSLLKDSNISTEGWLCYDYADYFNTTLKEKYPTLDVRWIRHMDICNNLTLCDSHHTYLDIGGYGQLCMLNSDRIDCVDFEI